MSIRVGHFKLSLFRFSRDRVHSYCRLIPGKVRVMTMDWYKGLAQGWHSFKGTGCGTQ